MRIPFGAPYKVVSHYKKECVPEKINNVLGLSFRLGISIYFNCPIYWALLALIRYVISGGMEGNRRAVSGYTDPRYLSQANDVREKEGDAATK